MDAVIDDPEHIADVLEAAADFIDVHGWTQGPKGCYPEQYGEGACINGAIRSVARNENLWIYENCYVTALARAINGRRPFAWNDDAGREAWEVTELLRDTAKRVRAGDIAVGAQK